MDIKVDVLEHEYRSTFTGNKYMIDVLGIISYFILEDD